MKYLTLSILKEYLKMMAAKVQINTKIFNILTLSCQPLKILILVTWCLRNTTNHYSFMSTWCSRKCVYFQRIASIWRYTDLFLYLCQLVLTEHYSLLSQFMYIQHSTYVKSIFSLGLLNIISIHLLPAAKKIQNCYLK